MAAYQDPLSLGFSWQEHWSGLSFPYLMHENEVAQSCPTPSYPMDCSPPGSSVHGIFQARVLEWGAIAFSPPNTSRPFSGLCYIPQGCFLPALPGPLGGAFGLCSKWKNRTEGAGSHFWSHNSPALNSDDATGPCSLQAQRWGQLPSGRHLGVPSSALPPSLPQPR